MHWNVPPDALPGSAMLVRVLDRWLNDCAKRAGVKNSEKIPSGEGGMGTLGPALPVNGEMLMGCSVDHCTFALHVQIIINYYKHFR